MRRFILLITTKNDNINLIELGKDLNIFLTKYDCMGVFDEAVNPLIIDEKNDDTGYS
jgi:hypothetical protein